MADVFEERPELVEPRRRLYTLIRATPWLDWLLLTKRPENFAARLPADWGAGYPNVWLGVSVEDQANAEKRIPPLLQMPAAIRFVSYEPALGPVDFGQLRNTVGMAEGQSFIDALTGRCWTCSGPDYYDSTSADASLDLIIVGGESGPGARPCDVVWIRSTVEQCKAAGVACFVKQLGAVPYDGMVLLRGGSQDYMRSRAGSDPSEWPEDLRVQEWPR